MTCLYFQISSMGMLVFSFHRFWGYKKQQVKHDFRLGFVKKNL